MFVPCLAPCIVWISSSHSQVPFTPLVEHDNEKINTIGQLFYDVTIGLTRTGGVFQLKTHLRDTTFQFNAWFKNMGKKNFCTRDLSSKKSCKSCIIEV